MAIAPDQIEDEQSSESQPASVIAASNKRLPGRVVVLIAMLIGMCVALSAIAFFGIRVSEIRSTHIRDEKILETTRTVLAELVSLNHNSAQHDLDRIANSATGGFLDQFNSVSATFAQVLGDGQVESTGAVREAAILETTDASVTVLAAVTSEVKNTQAPDGQQRVYRMKATLSNDNGEWLVSNVEFVS